MDTQPDLYLILRFLCVPLEKAHDDIFNTCIQHNIFPKQWKEAIVKAVPKKAKPSFPADYRQISLLSCVGKVFEGILRDAILEDTVTKIEPSQHGFMTNRSTDTALIQILQHWHEALNSSPKMDIHAVFVDFTRAFDTIKHCQLLYSLADLHVRRPLWLIVRSYLSNREQRVKWGSSVSNSFPVSAGVPQGGLLSPLLFVICINSLDSYLPPSVIPVKYADDLTITEFLMGSLPGLTQKALDSVVEWGQEFTLAMNGAKTVDMVISARRENNIPSPPSPVISGHAINRVSTFKLLGVQISSDLSWDAHVKYMISKVRPRIYYLCTAKKADLPCDVLVQVYLTFIRPVLEYASPVWGGLPKGLSEELERIQKRCCRIIGIPTSTLPALSERREEATIRTLTKILKDSSSPLHCFLPMAPTPTYSLRRHKTFVVTRSKTKRHELSFIPRALKLLYR